MPSFNELPLAVHAPASNNRDFVALGPELRAEPNTQYRRSLWVSLEIPGAKIAVNDSAAMRPAKLEFAVRIIRSQGSSKFENSFPCTVSLNVDKSGVEFSTQVRSPEIGVPVGFAVEVQFEVRGLQGFVLDLSGAKTAFADGELRIDSARRDVVP